MSIPLCTPEAPQGSYQKVSWFQSAEVAPATGIASLSGSVAGLDYGELFADAFGAVCAADSPLTKLGRPLRWSDLEGRALIANGLSRAIADPGYRALEQQARLMVRNVTSILALVRRGIGVTLLPRLAVPPEDEALRLLPLAAFGIRRHVGVIRRDGASLSPVAEAFSAALVRRCASAKPS